MSQSLLTSLTLDEDGIKDFAECRGRLVAKIALAAGGFMFWHLIVTGDNFVSSTMPLLVGFVLMAASTAAVDVAALAKFSEWCFGLGMTVLVCCGALAAPSQWVPSMCIGIVFSNYLSFMPSVAFVLVNVACHTLISQDTNAALIGMAMSFLVNQQMKEATIAATYQTQANVDATAQEWRTKCNKLQKASKNVKALNQVLLQSLDPSKNAGIGAGVVEELLERLDFLQTQVPTITEEMKPCKAKLLEYVAEADNKKSAKAVAGKGGDDPKKGSKDKAAKDSKKTEQNGALSAAPKSPKPSQPQAVGKKSKKSKA